MEELKVKVKIWDYRRKKNMSAGELAKVVGISEGALNYYETNRRSPRLDLLYDISVALEVSLFDLIDY